MTRAALRNGRGEATVAVVERPRSLDMRWRQAQPRWRLAWLWAGIWLAYLSQPFIDAWHERDPVRHWVGLAALVVFAATFIGAFAVVPRVMRASERGSVPVGAALTILSGGLAILITVLLGDAQLPIFVYVAVLAMFMLPGRWGPFAVAVLIAATALTQSLVPTWKPNYSVQFQIFVGGMAMWGVVQIIRRNRELDAAHQEIARLAVGEERNRFARDLHDILGHSLTVMAVKAELAGRLVRLDPQRAGEEIAALERLSRQALSEVRAAVAGYRDVTLAAELANARAALTAAGIDADLPSAIDDVPADRRELFGWVVREGVTNVVRHSGASRCRVRIEPSSVTVTDNGRSAMGAAWADPPDPADGGKGDGVWMEQQDGSLLERGHGLRGLRERADAAGAALLVGRAPEGGFALMVRL